MLKDNLTYVAAGSTLTYHFEEHDFPFTSKDTLLNRFYTFFIASFLMHVWKVKQ